MHQSTILSVTLLLFFALWQLSCWQLSRIPMDPTKTFYTGHPFPKKQRESRWKWMVSVSSLFNCFSLQIIDYNRFLGPKKAPQLSNTPTSKLTFTCIDPSFNKTRDHLSTRSIQILLPPSSLRGVLASETPHCFRVFSKGIGLGSQSLRHGIYHGWRVHVSWERKCEISCAPFARCLVCVLPQITDICVVFCW